jgi:hypothetical protein
MVMEGELEASIRRRIDATSGYDETEAWWQENE